MTVDIGSSEKKKYSQMKVQVVDLREKWCAKIHIKSTGTRKDNLALASIESDRTIIEPIEKSHESSFAHGKVEA